MKPAINPDEVARHAAQLFLQGYNCGQAVLVAFARHYDLTPEMASRMSAAFGGGMGLQRMTCGSVLAMAVLAGLEWGNETPADRPAMQRSFRAIQTLTARFIEQYGSATCGEIMGFKGFQKADGPAHHQPVPEAYRTRPCAMKVALCARLFAQLLTEDF